MPTILIIDDRASERRLLYHALKSDHLVLEAEDEETALRFLSSTDVDLVLLDMHLTPEMPGPAGGIRLHRLLREQRPDVPVVIASSDDDRDLVRRMRGEGATAYLVKPFPPGLLRGTIARVLGDP